MYIISTPNCHRERVHVHVHVGTVIKFTCSHAASPPILVHRWSSAMGIYVVLNIFLPPELLLIVFVDTVHGGHVLFVSWETAVI